MRVEFLKHTDMADSLILLFAGWGSDRRYYEHIYMSGWDVALVSGFDAELPSLEDIQRYSTVYVFAWSLGVWAAERVLAGRLEPTRAYAVNGTPWPFDDKRGIPTGIFRNTASGLSERNLHKFRVRMCGGVAAYKEKEALFSHLTDVDTLRAELEFVASHPGGRHLCWDSAYVSGEDHIFPAVNQYYAWEGRVSVHKLAGAHFVDLQEIVSRVIIDVQRVGKRFARSLSTYDSHAHAQRLIAETLAAKTFSGGEPSDTDTIVEIGPGTGMFTREWRKYVSPANAVFMDLYDMPKYGVAEREKYICGDAEKNIRELEPESVSAIVSGSAIQWFRNLPLFFANCRRALRSGGLIAMSTFAPGNLCELQRLREDHLQYLPADKLQEILTPLFSRVSVEEDVVAIDFTTPLEALRHLQLTGVTVSGGRHAGIGELRRFADTFPMNSRGRYTLTFRPVYILARK